MAKKGYNYPIKKKIPLILLLNLFGIFIISQLLRFVNIFSEVSEHYFPKNSLHLLLVNFNDNHCMRGHKYKNTAYLFRDIPYFR